MERGQDFDATVADAIGKNIRQARQDEFACPVHSPRTPDLRMFGQDGGSGFDRGHQCRRCGGTVSSHERESLGDFT